MVSNSDTGPTGSFLLRYGIVGVIGGIIQTLTLYVWVDVLRLEAYYLAGATMGFFAALLVTFTLQKYWTFRDHARAKLQRQFFSYTVIALLTAGFNISLLHLSKILLERFGLDFFRMWYVLAQVLIIAVIAVLSFLANYFITFRARRSEVEGG